MSTIVRDDDFRRVSAELGGVIITDTTSGESLAASLSADERSHLATALAPDRQAVPGCRCDELRSLIEGQKDNVTKAQRERDEATKRADELDKELAKVENRAVEWSIKAQQWQARANQAERCLEELQDSETKPAPTITADDIRKALAKCPSTYLHEPRERYLHDGWVVDVMCDLFGVKYEPVYQIEAKAEELFNVARPSTHVTWGDLVGEAKSQYRAIAAHVLGDAA